LGEAIHSVVRIDRLEAVLKKNPPLIFLPSGSAWRNRSRSPPGGSAQDFCLGDCQRGRK
jgi:hypothetical protein